MAISPYPLEAPNLLLVADPTRISRTLLLQPLPLRMLAEEGLSAANFDISGLQI